MSSPTSTLFSQNEKSNLRSHLKSTSISNSDTTTTTLTNAKTFRISASGIPLFRLPITSTELTTKIFAANGTLAYTSTRGKRSSGSCTLSSPSTGDLITTTYRFGPGKPPALRYVDTPKHADGEEVTLRGKWLARSQAFVVPSGHALEWRYIREMSSETGKKRTFLVLLDVSHGRVIAQLVRTDETRTEGSKKCSAGNGGLLLVYEDACEKVVDEALVIASCLVMLKKEIDRRRCMQAMVLSVAITGGSA